MKKPLIEAGSGASFVLDIILWVYGTRQFTTADTEEHRDGTEA